MSTQLRVAFGCDRSHPPKPKFFGSKPPVGETLPSPPFAMLWLRVEPISAGIRGPAESFCGCARLIFDVLCKVSTGSDRLLQKWGCERGNDPPLGYSRLDRVCGGLRSSVSNQQASKQTIRQQRHMTCGGSICQSKFYPSSDDGEPTIRACRGRGST